MITWNLLKEKHKDIQDRAINSLFDDTRAQSFSIDALDMLFDYSKTNIDDDVRDLLLDLAQPVVAKRAAMFAGEKINDTEKRAVLHTALRNIGGDPIVVDGENVMPDVEATFERMVQFSETVRDGSFKGQGGPITDVVNIGIGGSDLGPAMAVLALAPYHSGPRCHFVSNVDGAHIADTLRDLNPETTLIIVASKTFTTIETITNAKAARDWMARSVENPGTQFVALSSALDKTADFGIAEERVFGFEDWVGGRYSVWGPIGLSLMIAIGGEQFRSFLSGAKSMDDHFRTADFAENMPVMLALVGLWHNQICGYASRGVMPYEQRLSRLPAYLQQLEMESNGKRVGMDGAELPYHSGPIVWGEPGTNGQHAFYQLIHQGTRVIPVEFLVAAQGHEPDLAYQHQLLMANCFAQSEALMNGRDFETAQNLMAQKRFTGEELTRQANHRVFPGNRPSTTLVYPKLTPSMLGKLIALYEHRVFVEGAILGINSFDQWGVELGKELAVALQPIVQGDKTATDKDGSTQQLIKFIQAHS
ncbi:glucose-6-phosphate isomerase [Cochlodiniinecator piscidefendens]|uniref:glucose-6-phosphate isomerase n=1 Tax=Cochlodiniinecator piscidefendens TaxID=2715756 RepID=UPI00140816D3|nr:glucose-6-phosphate isomerase [Cochlodiniinecator piscidefendens]